MRRTWSVAIARTGQDAVAWQRIGDEVQRWADRMKVTAIGEIMWLADTDAFDVARAMSDALAAAGTSPIRSSRTLYDEADHEAADFVALTGVDLSLDPPFVKNEAEVYRPDPACAHCGHCDAFDVTVVGTPRIDEKRLDRRAPDGTRPGPAGWEVVNLPNGGLLISQRLATAFREARLQGIGFVPVHDAQGRASTRMTALRAEVTVLVPCPRHTRIEGDPFCPACGTAFGTPDGTLWMPRSQVGVAEVVSRHPRGAAMFHTGRRAFGLLEHVAGVRRGDPVRLCDD